MDRNTVVQDVKIRFFEINNLPALRVTDVCTPDIPLHWNSPVEYPGSGWDFLDCERYVLLKNLQSLPHSVAGNTAANRIEFAHQLVHFSAGFTRIDSGLVRLDTHSRQLSTGQGTIFHYDNRTSGLSS